MELNLKTAGAEVQKVWQGWSAKQRILFGVGSAVAVLSMVLLVTLTTRVGYAPLMTSLSNEDAADVVAALEAERVSYRITAGGSAILVPEADVHRVRMKIAAAGLPKGGGVGFEIFDDPQLGVSRFAEQLNYRRALEGELRRTIRSMDPVHDARVHIVMPEKSLFRDHREEARASINVHLRPGRALSQGQVQAIVHLVSSAVPGLSAENITVVNAQGTMLARGGDDMAMMNRALEYQKELEKYFEERISRIVEHSVGQGRAWVRVAAELTQKSHERTVEKFDPTTAVVRSEQINEEERGAGEGTAGIPGTRSNLQGGTASPTVESQNSGSRKETLRNFDVDKTTERDVVPAGSLSRISVAVLVDGKRAVAADGTESFTPRTDQELGQLTNLVKKAVGFDATRGDQVTVQNIAAADAVEPAEIEPTPHWFDVWGPRIVPVAALLVVLLVAVGVFMASRRKKQDQSGLDTYTAIADEILEAPTTVRELEEAIQQRTGMLPSAQQSSAPISLEPAPPDAERAAAVIKEWIYEE